MEQCICYILRGDIYLLDYDRAHEGYGDCYGFNYGGGNAKTYAGVMVGNGLLNVNLQINELTKISRRGLEMAGCYYPDLTGSTVEMSLMCTSQKNLAMAFQGLQTSTASTAGNVIDEIYTSPCDDGFEEGAFIRFTNPVDVTTVVLKRDDTLAVLILGQDYTVNELGWTMLVGLPQGVSILATYTSVVRSIQTIESFISKPKTFRITVVGENVSADNPEMYVWTFKKVRLSPLTNQFQIINEDFPDLNFNGAILKDQLADLNESPFMTEERIS